MKKFLTYTLLLVMLLGLCACDSGKGKSAAATGSDLSWEEIEKLAEKELAADDK